ncbi:nicotinamidase-related amidase [Curtobacterium luteum]|uniref:Isochorismatase n=1 Tax=Curtobacterium luteum TaxID=33881 RepID=A0A8H9G828_9MICO|nr:cysteine hydrolase [Curtobacterium luteum]MBM7801794.1 nicotinamidase-related amidase [Curtobacterium luteum]GGK87630.1 isochorismatase [Curtobacterium luteum]
MTVPDDAWLVVVDMQEVFTGESPWAAPRYTHAGVTIEHLLPRFTGRTVFTRFVAPSQPEGAWVPYYREWPFALVPDGDPLYALTEPFATAAADRGDPVVTEPTFGKWGTSLLAVVGDHPHLVLTGVSTDCCVLSTALAAADAGATVTVVADACAGASDEDHERALAAMRLYAPLITVVDSANDL